MPSFDVVSEFDEQELRNAVDQANREITNRFDLKGTKSSYEFDASEMTINILADNEFQIDQLREILENKLIKRQLDIRILDPQTIDVALHQSRQVIKLKKGLDQPLAKKIIQSIKDSKLKVQASIQSDKIRVTGKNRDDLQTAIKHLKSAEWPLPLQYENFRD